MGKVSDEAAITFLEELQIPLTVEEYQAECAVLFEDQFTQTEVLPGKIHSIDLGLNSELHCLSMSSEYSSYFFCFENYLV